MKDPPQLQQHQAAYWYQQRPLHLPSFPSAGGASAPAAAGAPSFGGLSSLPVGATDTSSTQGAPQAPAIDFSGSAAGSSIIGGSTAAGTTATSEPLPTSSAAPQQPLMSLWGPHSRRQVRLPLQAQALRSGAQQPTGALTASQPQVAFRAQQQAPPATAVAAAAISLLCSSCQCTCPLGALVQSSAAPAQPSSAATVTGHCTLSTILLWWRSTRRSVQCCKYHPLLLWCTHTAAAAARR